MKTPTIAEADEVNRRSNRESVMKCCKSMNRREAEVVCSTIREYTKKEKFLYKHVFKTKLLRQCLMKTGLTVEKLNDKSVAEKWTPEKYCLELGLLAKKQAEITPVIHRLAGMALSDKRSHLVKCVRSEIEGE